MRSIEAGFQAHLEQVVTTLATCYRITRPDGEQFGFISCDVPVTIDGVTYQPLSVMNNSDIEQEGGMAAANFEISAVIDSATLLEDDLLFGIYDGAKVDKFRINYMEPPESLEGTDLLLQATATMGEVTVIDGEMFSAPLRGLKDRLNIKGTQCYSQNCRVKRLGDEHCKISLSPHRHTYTVATILNPLAFTHSSTAQADHYFQKGVLEWTTGDNDGYESEIKTYQNGIIELVDPPRYELTAGDQFRAVRGCNRLFSTCKDVFNNVENYRGEPHVPGTDELLSKKL